MAGEQPTNIGELAVNTTCQLGLHRFEKTFLDSFNATTNSKYPEEADVHMCTQNQALAKFISWRAQATKTRYWANNENCEIIQEDLWCLFCKHFIC